MQKYLKLSLILSFFGFLKEFRPSEPFLAEFLKDFKEIDVEVMTKDIYPIGAYSYLAQIAVVFLITDLLRYKPLIVLNGACGVIIWAILIWANSVISVQVVQGFWGTFCAAEVAYFSYIYAKTDKKHFQAVTAHTRAAIFLGRFFSSLIAQTLVFVKVMNYRQLNYLTLIALAIATIWALFIPKVETSVYFHRDKSEGNTPTAFHLIWKHFKSSYKHTTVIVWSIYYAISLCFYTQIMVYIQVLYISINDTEETIYNAAVDATLTLLGAAMSLLAGKIRMEFLGNPNQALLTLVAMSSVQGIFVILAATSRSLMACYVFYICYAVSYSFGIAISAIKIAENLASDTFGLVFGFNTLVALIVQTVVTLSVVSNGFQLSSSGQFQVYGWFHIALGAAYLMKILLVNFTLTQKARIPKTLVIVPLQS